MKLEKLEEEHRRNQSELAFEEISENSLNLQQPVSSSKPKAQGGLFSSFFGGSSNQQDQQEEQPVQRLQELEYAQFRNDQDYEINKYIQSNIKPVQLPSVPQSLRTTNNQHRNANGDVVEFSQRSPRSQMEISIIKNLISSYFNVVRKNLNDIVPKTIIAMLVNKTKN